MILNEVHLIINKSPRWTDDEMYLSLQEGRVRDTCMYLIITGSTRWTDSPEKGIHINTLLVTLTCLLASLTYRSYACLTRFRWQVRLVS